MLKQNAIEIIKNKLNIVDIVSRYVKLLPSGNNFKGLSPFVQEKTPSFFVSSEKDLYYCFSTHKGGDIFSFVQEMEKMDFKESLVFLAEIANVDLKDYLNIQKDETANLYQIMEMVTKYYSQTIEKSKKAKDYLMSRGLNAESIEVFRIGYAPNSWSIISDGLKKKGFSGKDIIETGLVIPKKNNQNDFYDRFRGRIMFPVFDQKNRVVGFSARILPDFAISKNGQVNAKYINSPETSLYHKSKILFGFSLAKNHLKSDKSAILVEGQMDVVLAHQFGYKETVGLSGTALSFDQLNLIGRFTKNLIIALDSDRAGINATHQSVLEALKLGFKVKVAILPKGNDPADILLKDKNIWDKAINEAKSYLHFRLDLFSKDSDSTGFDLLEIIRKQLYPFLLAISGDIEKDQAIQIIAERIKVPAEVVRKDFTKSVKNNELNFGKNKDDFVSKKDKTFDQKNNVWSIDDTSFIFELSKKPDRPLFPKLWDFIKKDKDCLEFEKFINNELNFEKKDQKIDPSKLFLLDIFEESVLINNIKESIFFWKIKKLEEEKYLVSEKLKILNTDEKADDLLKTLKDIQNEMDRLKQDFFINKP